MIVIVVFIVRIRAARAPHFTTAPAVRQTIEDILIESGNAEAQGQASIFSSATGIIEDIFVTNGQMVVVGENLFKVRVISTPSDKASAIANLQNALVSLNQAQENKLTLQAQLEKDRQAVLDAQNNVNFKDNNTINPATNKPYTDLEKDSVNSSLISAREVFSADEKKYLDADTAIAAAQAKVNSSQTDLGATEEVTVTAPVEGTVGNISVHIGDEVTGNAMTATTSTANQAISPVMIVGALCDACSIFIQANEVDIPKIKIGQTSKINFTALPNETFNGTVASIDSFGTNTSGVITYNVLVDFLNPSFDIKPGMSANVMIVVASHKNALTVPNAAIKPYKGGSAVEVIKTARGRQQLQFIPVKTGIRGLTRTEIVSGIKPGTQVVISQ